MAFRVAVLSVLKQHTPPLQRSQGARSFSMTSQVLANGASPKPKARFKKNAFVSGQEKPAEEPKRKKADGPLKDEDIKYPRVQITHDGRLSAPTTITRVLSLLDRRGYYIQLVSQKPPVVKIVNKSEEYNRKKQEQEQAKLLKAKHVHKELQLTWATGEADATHKLEKAREDLARGFRVDIVFEHKRGQPSPSHQQMQERVQAVVDSLADVSMEWKERQIQRRIAAVFLRGTGTSSSEPEQERDRKSVV